MGNEFPYDLFLSHSSKDKVVVRGIAERLQRDGLKVWFDEWEIKPGDNIPAKIEAGLEHSRTLVLCMSVSAFGSDWAQLETGTFRFRDPLNKDRRFIPLRLDKEPIKGSLAQFRYIDWTAKDHEQEYVKLLDACRSPMQPIFCQMDKVSPVSTQAQAMLVPQITLSMSDANTMKCGWDIWNFGKDVPTAVTLEIRARIYEHPQLDGPIDIANITPDSEARCKHGRQEGYYLLNCHFLPNAIPIRRDCGHSRILDMFFRMPEPCEWKIINSADPEKIHVAKVKLDWVLTARLEPNAEGSFVLPLSYESSNIYNQLVVGRKVKSWRGITGEAIDVTRTKPTEEH